MQAMRTIVVGTRQSALALTQTNQVIEQLQQICRDHGLPFEFAVRKMVTKGDRILDVTLSKVGGKGLFVKEIEQALIDKQIDMAVHSMKDMPAELPEGLVIGAVPKRVDPRDILITSHGVKLAELPQGAKIGTSSLRRACQIQSYRPDLNVEPIRGNIDTRIQKLQTEGFDAIVLAAAGLLRMDWEDRISEYLDPEICLPAVGQGALGIECRADDEEVLRLLSQLNDRMTMLAVNAERSFLHKLNGGCQIPIGAFATIPNWSEDMDADVRPQVRLTGMVGSPDGRELVKETMSGTNPEQLGVAVAEQLIARGADRILMDARG
jgi:hydroxymethylbilane synthase